MSFTDGKPRIATEEECKAEWGGFKNGAAFKCYLCGHKFKPGDGWRWLCAPTGNFMTCEACDGDDVKSRFAALREEFKSEKFWWFRQNERNIGAYEYA